jgi:DNA polymerase-3 subunit epsilon
MRENSPFESKDVLKRRGYRWNDGSDGRPKSWWIDVADGGVEAEVTFLRTEVFQYSADVRTRRVTAFDRFSDRV